jgi:hypothetical protein
MIPSIVPHISRILAPTALSLAAVDILFPLFSCHESYGNYPVYWLGCLILWWVMSFIHIDTSHASEQT